MVCFKLFYAYAVSSEVVIIYIVIFYKLLEILTKQIFTPINMGHGGSFFKFCLFWFLIRSSAHKWHYTNE